MVFTAFTEAIATQSITKTPKIPKRIGLLKRASFEECIFFFLKNNGRLFEGNFCGNTLQKKSIFSNAIFRKNRNTYLTHTSHIYIVYRSII